MVSPLYFVSFISRVALVSINTIKWFEVPILAAQAISLIVSCEIFRSTNLDNTKEGPRQNNIVFSRFNLLVMLLVPQLVLSQIFEDVFIYL